MQFPWILHKITIHLPQTGLEVFGSKLQNFISKTIAPTNISFKCRSFRPIISHLEQKLNFQFYNIRNGGLEPPQCSPMGPNFFLAWKWCIFAGIWAYEPGRSLLKGQKPEIRRRSTGFGCGSSIFRFLGTFWYYILTALKCGGESKYDDDFYCATKNESNMTLL